MKKKIEYTRIVVKHRVIGIQYRLLKVWEKILSNTLVIVVNLNSEQRMILSSISIN